MRDELIKLLGEIEELFLVIPRKDRKRVESKIANIDRLWNSLKKKILGTYF